MIGVGGGGWGRAELKYGMVWYGMNLLCVSGLGEVLVIDSGRRPNYEVLV